MTEEEARRDLDAAIDQRDKAYEELDSLKKRLDGLIRVFKAADQFAGMFGTEEHPVEDWFDDEFVELEVALSDFKENEIPL